MPLTTTMQRSTAVQLLVVPAMAAALLFAPAPAGALQAEAQPVASASPGPAASKSADSRSVDSRSVDAGSADAGSADLAETASAPAPAASARPAWLPVSAHEPLAPPEGQSQVKDDLFAGTEKFAHGASDVTDVNLGPDMLSMVGKGSGDLAKKMQYVLVRTYTYPHADMYNLADVDAYRQKLHDGSWNCFIHTFESKTGQSTDICNRAAPDHSGNEMVIMTVEPKELTFIHMAGNVSLSDLGSMGSMANIPRPPAPPPPPPK